MRNGISRPCEKSAAACAVWVLPDGEGLLEPSVEVAELRLGERGKKPDIVTIFVRELQKQIDPELAVVQHLLPNQGPTESGRVYGQLRGGRKREGKVVRGAQTPSG